MDAKQDDGGKGAKTVRVAIPSSLAERIERRLPKSRFKTVDEYISYVAEQVLSEVEAGERRAEQAFSKEDQAAVEKKLRELGYI